MNLSDKDIALLMVACDNTRVQLTEAALEVPAVDRVDIVSQAEGLSQLWNRLNNERVAREEGRKNPSRWSGLTVYK